MDATKKHLPIAAAVATHRLDRSHAPGQRATSASCLLRATVALNRHPDLWFWGVTFILNAVLFLPFYVLQPVEWGLFPVPNRDIRTLYDLLVRREHGDLLRLNAELILMLTLWAFWSRLRVGEPRWFRRIIVFYFVLALAYQIYAGAMIGLYHNTPNLYNDYPFIIGGVRFVLEAVNFPTRYYILGAIAAIAILASLSLLLCVLLWGISAARLSRVTRFLLLTMTAFTVGCAFFYGTGLADPYMVVHSVIAETVENVQLSLQSRREVADLSHINPYTTYDYTAYTLRQHPNIYLIFVESYGSVLYTRTYYRDTYLSLMRSWQTRLEAAGWHTVSTMSVSPTWGGGSWMAYASAMFGLRIHQQPAYLALREKYRYLPYPNLGRYLHSQGYEYIWLVPIARRLYPAIEEKNRRFYGADRWITFSALHYHGPLYGWGPSPPDQYTLGYVRELAREATQPIFLFFLTQSSHYPWIPLAPVVEDWRTLAHSEIEGGTLGKEEQQRISYAEARRNYINAMTYELNMLGDFLLNLEDEDVIVVLMGDHQPPAVSARSDGYATIVHILSRDAAFVRSFEAYGFTPGLVLTSPQATMHHEGFYSMFVRELLAHYGVDPQHLPPYLPRGLPVGDDVRTSKGR